MTAAQAQTSPFSAIRRRFRSNPYLLRHIKSYLCDSYSIPYRHVSESAQGRRYCTRPNRTRKEYLNLQLIYSCGIPNSSSSVSNLVFPLPLDERTYCEYANQVNFISGPWRQSTISASSYVYVYKFQAPPELVWRFVRDQIGLLRDSRAGTSALKNKKEYRNIKTSKLQKGDKM